MIGPGRLGCQKLRRAFCSSGFWGWAATFWAHRWVFYRTFVIEERFGFNKMTLGTYFGDKVKGYVIGGLLGAAVLGGILFFLAEAGPFGWLYAWAVVGAFIVLMPPLYTSVIAPMFNKFVPLEDGELRESLDAYAKEVDFPLTGVFVMDGVETVISFQCVFQWFW